jgi:hypothetical protein
MLGKSKGVVFAGLLVAIALGPAQAAEREDVRKIINLVTSVKMPFPESLSRSRAKTERVWLERLGATTGCIELEERAGATSTSCPRATSRRDTRIRNEPARGVYIGALYHYVADYDLDGLIDLGSTTRIDPLDNRRPATPIANVIQFYHRSTKRGEPSSSDYQKTYDEGIGIALRYFGE